MRFGKKISSKGGRTLVLAAFLALLPMTQVVAQSALKVLKKGAVCIEGNEIEGEGTSILKATGLAVVTVGGQSSKLEGDTVIYDKTGRTIEANGHAKMFRNGFETRGDSLKFIIDEPQRLITEEGTVLSEPYLVKRRTPLSIGDAASLGLPVEGASLYQRYIVGRLLKAAAAADLDVTTQVREYEAIEDKARKGMPAADFQADLDTVRRAVSDELGGKRLLTDQSYGSGPLSKLCSKIKEDLRQNWQKASGFDKKVYVFFSVKPDGKITDIEMDGPVKYGAAANAIAIARVKALDLGGAVSGASPVAVPIVLSLSNDAKDIDAYVRFLNLDTYVAAAEAKLRTIYKSIEKSENGKMTVHVLVLADGTVKEITVASNEFSTGLQNAIVAAVRKSGKLSPFPDGIGGDMTLEFAFSRSEYPRRNSK